MAIELKEGIKQIKSSIQDKQFSEGIRVADNFIAKFPNNIQIQLLRAQLDEKTDSVTQALERYENLQVKYPDNPYPLINLARLSLDNKDLKKTQSYLEKIAEIPNSGEKVLPLKIRLARDQGNEDLEIKLLEEIIRIKESPTASSFIRLANLYIKKEDFIKAANIMAIAGAKHPNNKEFDKPRYHITKNHGDAEAAIKMCQTLIRNFPDEKKWIAELMNLMALCGRSDEAVGIFENSINNGNDSFEVYQKALNLTLPKNLQNKMISWAESINENSTPNEKSTAKAILMCLNNEQSNVFLVNRSFNAPSIKDLKRPLIKDETAEVTLGLSKTSDKLILVFTGLAARTGMPITLLDSYFAYLNISAVYLRDNTRLLFNNGIGSISKDYNSTLAYLRNLIRDSNASTVITLGSSAGGFGAIRYGIDLNAAKVLAFSTTTNINYDFLENDGRARILAKRVQSLPAEVRDLKPIIIQAKKRPSINLFYGEAMAQDTLHAKHLDNIENVNLHPIAGESGHNLLGIWAEKGKLMDFFKKHL